MSDLRPDIGAALRVFGLPATVTLPGEEPVATTAIWLPPMLVDTAGVLIPTTAPQAVLVLPRADVPVVPRGTRIDLAKYEGGPVRSWIVESIVSGQEPEEPHPDDDVRVVVIPAESA
jgi:hypothetical protein